MKDRETEGEKKRQNNYYKSHVVSLMLSLIKYKSYWILIFKCETNID